MTTYLNIVRGNHIFCCWKESGWKDFDKKVHELRMMGFRKIDKELDFQNYYEYYRQKGKKKIVTVTMMLS